MPGLIRLLEHARFRSRIAAMEALGALRERPHEVMRALLQTLRDEHFRVAEAAVTALAGIMLGQEELAALGSALADADPLIAGRAARVLAAQGEHGLPILIDFLKRRGPDPPEGIFPVFRKVGAGAVPPLVALVETLEAPAVRRGARALGELGSLARAAVPALEASLATVDRLAALEAARALWRISARPERSIGLAVEVLKAGEAEERVLATRLLSEIGPPSGRAAPLLVEAVRNGHGALAAAAAEALATAGAQDEEAVEVLRERCHDPQPEVRRACVDALGGHGVLAGRAVPDLAAHLRDPDLETRRASALALGKVGLSDPGAARELGEVLRERDPAICRVVCQALGAMGWSAEPAIPALIEALQVPALRSEALQALERIPGASERALPGLLGTFDSSGYEFRQVIARGLARFGESIAPVILEELSAIAGQEDRRGRIGTELLRIVVKLGPAARRGLPDLLKLLSDRNYFIRQSAARALGAIGPEAREAAPRLREMLGNLDESLEVIVAVRDALRRIEGGKNR